MFDHLTEPRAAGDHFAAYVTGDVFDVLDRIPDRSIDLVMTSPPFLALRSYLPADHPDKAKEIGSEATPADFLDTLLDVVEACDRVLAPHGSLVFELGDTYSGSGGAGGDYNAEGLRDGQPKFDGSASRARPDDRFGDGRTWEHEKPRRAQKRDGMRPHPGWPPAKSLTGIPTLFAWSLAYGRNLLRPERLTEPWRIRNVVAWVRPNPPVGALGDKFRPATSYLTVATKASDRYFDLEAVRQPPSPNSHPRTAKGVAERENDTKSADDPRTGGNRSTLKIQHDSPEGGPPLDWWQIPPGGYRGAHYAVYPPELCIRTIEAMCPRRVCVECGEPSRRIVEAAYAGDPDDRTRKKQKPQHRSRVDYPPEEGWERGRRTVGWSDCGHDAWRPGVVLDPFAGTFTTGVVAHGHGRSAIGIDLDGRNADLARERLGMFLEIYGEPASRPVETVETEVL